MLLIIDMVIQACPLHTSIFFAMTGHYPDVEYPAWANYRPLCMIHALALIKKIGNVPLNDQHCWYPPPIGGGRLRTQNLGLEALNSTMSQQTCKQAMLPPCWGKKSEVITILGANSSSAKNIADIMVHPDPHNKREPQYTIGDASVPSTFFLEKYTSS